MPSSLSAWAYFRIVYQLQPLEVVERPDSVLALSNYALSSTGVPDLFGQNVPAAFEPQLGSYSGSLANVATTVDYAVVLPVPPTGY